MTIWIVASIAGVVGWFAARRFVLDGDIGLQLLLAAIPFSVAVLVGLLWSRGPKP